MELSGPRISPVGALSVSSGNVELFDSTFLGEAGGENGFFGPLRALKVTEICVYVAFPPRGVVLHNLQWQ
jgi:hypothetical protein